MRLSLRKRLKPYRSFKQLADDLDITIPELKKRIRSLELEGNFTLDALLADSDLHSQLQADEIFKEFHKQGSCLVCGHEMVKPGKRDIGWGEFKQCPKCGFAAHDLANFQTRKKAAKEMLDELVGAAEKTRSVLAERMRNSAKL